jgi:hypothetical protein
MVADGDRLVRIDSRGTVLLQSGRRGRGPGEFQRIVELCALTADTIAVEDLNGRVSLWDHNVKHLRTVVHQQPIVRSSCDGKGHMIAHEAPRASRIDSRGRERRIDHWLVDPLGDRVARLDELPGAVMAGTMIWSPYVAWSNGELVIARGRHFELEWRSRTGRVRQIMLANRNLVVGSLGP